MNCWFVLLFLSRAFFCPLMYRNAVGMKGMHSFELRTAWKNVVCVHVCMCMDVRRGWRGMAVVSLSHFRLFFLEVGFPTLTPPTLGCLDSKPQKSSHLHTLRCWGSHSHTWLFIYCFVFGEFRVWVLYFIISSFFLSLRFPLGPLPFLLKFMPSSSLIFILTSMHM